MQEKILLVQEKKLDFMSDREGTTEERNAYLEHMGQGI